MKKPKETRSPEELWLESVTKLTAAYLENEVHKTEFVSEIEELQQQIRHGQESVDRIFAELLAAEPGTPEFRDTAIAACEVNFQLESLKNRLTRASFELSNARQLEQAYKRLALKDRHPSKLEE